MLAAFAMVADDHPGWSLTIRGDGDARQELETQRDRLGLNGRVSFRAGRRIRSRSFDGGAVRYAIAV